MDPKTANRAMEALWWLIEKETCAERRRLHINRLLDVAPRALQASEQSFDRDQITKLVERLRKTA